MSKAAATERCDAPEARQFDFWLGEWDLCWGEDGKGKNVITKEYGGCVIQEKFDGRPTLDMLGMSVSTYDVKRGVWQQTWVDNYGNYFDLEGGFENGEMALVCEKEVEGKAARLRMVFYHIEADALDWRWERSFDDGATWEKRWEIHYRRAVD